jgi:hypothetical protein
MNDKPSNSAWIVSALFVVMLLPMIYVAGYFALSTVTVDGFSRHAMRIFPNEWIASKYRPLARLESTVRGKSYIVAWPAPSQ